jgi:hypothetical protein
MALGAEAEIVSGSCNGMHDHTPENIPRANKGPSTVPEKSGAYTVD